MSNGLLSAIKEHRDELPTFLRLLGLFLAIWPFAFLIDPHGTVKDTVALIRGHYGDDLPYPAGDPRNHPYDRELDNSSEDLF